MEFVCPRSILFNMYSSFSYSHDQMPTRFSWSVIQGTALKLHGDNVLNKIHVSAFLSCRYTGRKETRHYSGYTFYAVSSRLGFVQQHSGQTRIPSVWRIKLAHNKRFLCESVVSLSVIIINLPGVTISKLEPETYKNTPIVYIEDSIINIYRLGLS